MELLENSVIRGAWIVQEQNQADMALVKRAGKAEDEILKFSARIANLAGFCRYFRRYFDVRYDS